MTLQDFIPIWQAQPFRAFLLHTDEFAFPIEHPLMIALSPQLRVVVVSDDVRTESFSLEEIRSCQITGKPTDLATLFSAVDPQKLARAAQLLAAATTDPATEAENAAALQASFDPGTVTFQASRAADGVFVVHASVTSREGVPLFDTAGTRWNIHGVEKFANGTSLFLHHLDHPTEEQRIILWPPDTGTFDSFAEAQPLPALAQELRARGRRLTLEPAPEIEPSAAYFRGIVPAYKPAPRNPRAAAQGEDPDDMTLGYGFEKIPGATADGKAIDNPRLTDLFRDEVIFDLSDTEWDASLAKQKPDDAPAELKLHLRHRADRNRALVLAIAPRARAARIDEEATAWPLAFVERHLRNFTLYEPWDLMLSALRAGPRAAGEPDVVLPVAGEFRIELWAGEPRFALPFLQPRIVGPWGRTVLDLRNTPWTASVWVSEDRPVISLRLISEDRKDRQGAADLELFLDLLAHRVRCRGLEGSTSLGMLQAIVRRVRGAKWMKEDLPAWFAKGESLPLPPGALSGD